MLIRLSCHLLFKDKILGIYLDMLRLQFSGCLHLLIASTSCKHSINTLLIYSMKRGLVVRVVLCFT